MRIATWMAAASLLALGACGGGEENGTAGNDAAAAESPQRAASGGEEIKLQPGEWEMKVEVKNAGMPGMEGMGDAMKNVSTTTKSCITEEDVGKPGMFTGKQDANCKTEGFAAKGGKVSGTVTCTGEGGQGSMKMTTEGQFTPTSFESTTKSEIDAEGMKMTTEARVTGRRIGECPAGANSAEDSKGRTKTGG